MARLPGRPPRWTEDGLSSFLEAAFANRLATFVHKTEEFDRLAALDNCFERVFKDWLNPASLVGAHLFLRSHATYRAACEHAMAGQVPEAFAMIRASLESAAYGLHIWKNDRDELWLRRHDDTSTMAAMKKEFTQANLRKTLAAGNRKAAEVYDVLYQQAIDFGAHPNERAVTGSMDILEEEGRREFRQIYLHENGLQLDHTLKSVARCGVCVLETMEVALGPRFELLGVKHSLLSLRQGL